MTDDRREETVRFRWGATTDVGRVRRVNQDRLLARNGLFVVADGMGGHQGGEVASQLAVDAVAASFDEPDLRHLVASVSDANDAILHESVEQPDLAGMGTTLCALALIEIDEPEPTIPTPVVDTDPSVGRPQPDEPERPPPQLKLAVANVGDSRIYRHFAGELTQITEDHSLVEELVRSGRLSPEEADDHPQRNILTRALGVSPDLQVDVWELPIRAGDRFVLCSDGLFNEVTDAQIAATLRRLDDPEQAATELVRLANDNGSHDNVTVIVVDVEPGVDDDELWAGSPEAAASTGAPAVIDLAGFTQAGSSDGRTPHAEADSQPTAPSDSVVSPHADDERGRRVGIGTIAFVVLILAVLGVGAATIGVYARSNYFVGIDGDELVVYRGRPGGVLWFDPTVSERTGVRTDELTPALLEEVLAEPEYSSVGDARVYVAGLIDRAAPEEPNPTPVPTVSPTPPPQPSPTSVAEERARPTPTSIAEGQRPTPTSIAQPTAAPG